MILPQSAVNDETRLALRDKALASAYFMSKGVIGFKDMVAPLHVDMSDWIGNGAQRKLGLVPRDHLKTSIWTIADTVRRISGNPNLRVLLGNETSTNASHFLRRIEAVFERNALYQWLFPELIPDWAKVKKWNETEMLIPRPDDFPESTVECIGVGGAVVSRHYELIKLDDLVGKEASESSEVMKKVIDWYQYCESLLVKPDNEIHTYGTRWAPNDLYDWARKNEGDYLDYFFRTCYAYNGDPIWPERFTHESLERIKRKMLSFKFSCQYLNNPVDPEAGGFLEKDLRWFDWEGGAIIPQAGSGRERIEVHRLARYMRVDPAISEKRGAARSAIVVDGVHSNGRIFLLEAWAKRCQPYEMIEQMFKFQQEYQCESVGIEAIAYQRILKPLVEDECSRRGVWLNVIDMKPDTRERKENRIRGSIQPYLQRGLIWVNKEHRDFLEEYSEFPNGRTVDILDAFGYGPQQWGEPMDEDDGSEIREFEDTPGRSIVTGY